VCYSSFTWYSVKTVVCEITLSLIQTTMGFNLFLTFPSRLSFFFKLWKIVLITSQYLRFASETMPPNPAAPAAAPAQFPLGFPPAFPQCADEVSAYTKMFMPRGNDMRTDYEAVMYPGGNVNPALVIFPAQTAAQSNLIALPALNASKIEIMIKPLQNQPPPNAMRFNGMSVRASVRYLNMICQYVNSNALPPRNNHQDIPVCCFMDFNFYCPGFYNHSYPELNRDHDDPGNWYRVASRALTAAGYGPDRFLKIRNIFIPIFSARPSLPNGYGMCMAVISPLSRSIDILDAHPGDDRQDDQILRDLYTMIAYHLERPKGNNEPTFDARDWTRRVNALPKYEPGRYDDAGVYALTGALCVAFGYSLDFKGLNTDNRRRRIAAELAHGTFENLAWNNVNPPEYTYPLVPRGLGHWKHIHNTKYVAWPTFRPFFMKKWFGKDLPEAQRATGVIERKKYRKIKNKTGLAAYCKKSPKRYKGYTKWIGRGQKAQDLREDMEMRDLAIEENRWP
jgi:hypothetical protein